MKASIAGEPRRSFPSEYGPWIENSARLRRSNGAVARVAVARADAGDETCSATRRVERDVCIIDSY